MESEKNSPPNVKSIISVKINGLISDIQEEIQACAYRRIESVDGLTFNHCKLGLYSKFRYNNNNVDKAVKYAQLIDYLANPSIRIKNYYIIKKFA